VSEAAKAIEVDVDIVELALTRQALPDHAFLGLCINDRLMCTPFGVIFRERLLEEDL
jgi:hypothetical protein